MAAPIVDRVYTPEEYLELERASETKNEYFQGEIIPMTGASRRHNLITGNAYASLHSQLRKRSAEVYASDMRVKVSESGLYTYPDIVIAESPVLEDHELDTLLNPQVIIEVLSTSTEQYDRGRKFEQYRDIDSLVDYLLIGQERYHVEHFVRQPDSSWNYKEFKELSNVVSISSIECELLLEDVYAKIILDQTNGTYAN